MISLEDCIAMCGLDADGVAAIAEHEHIPEIAAAALASYLLNQAGGSERNRRMMIDDIHKALDEGRIDDGAELFMALRHFLSHHPEATVKAREIMTANVVSVRPDTPTREVARLMLDNRISAVPVADDNGAPLGMVSEGDLIDRGELDREVRRDWWLAMLAEGESLSQDFLSSLHAPKWTAGDVMTAPVVAVDEDAKIREIARLLDTHRIKRVPVLRGGRLVGIVSRADLVRAMAT